MTHIRIGLAALVLGGLGFGQVPNVSIGPPLPFWPQGPGYALQKVLALNEQQIQRVTELRWASEDETYPLFLEQFEKGWELTRLLRSPEPNKAMLEMIYDDMKRIHEEVRTVRARYRSMLRAILSKEQLAVLSKLDSALQLMPAAWEAVYLNLIDEPAIAWAQELSKTMTGAEPTRLPGRSPRPLFGGFQLPLPDKQSLDLTRTELTR